MQTERKTKPNRNLSLVWQECRRTICLDNIPLPAVSVPDGFQLYSANYLLRGICPSCRHKKR